MYRIVQKLSNSYTLWQYVVLFIMVCRTKLICRHARIFRFPVHIRGRKYISFGKNLTTGYNCRFEAFPLKNNKKKKLFFGSNVQINDNVHISVVDSVIIGSNTLIASNVYISDNSHGSYKGDITDTSPFIPPSQRPYRISPVRIGECVWIGESVIILPGITIGSGAVIGAHSIVNKDIPSNCIAVGNPVRIIKKWDDDINMWIRIEEKL